MPVTRISLGTPASKMYARAALHATLILGNYTLDSPGARNRSLDKQQGLLYISAMLKCPHCGKAISDAIITAHSGKIGGRETAKRGPDYFRKIAAMRKTRAGGRPKKEKTPKT
jgi:hypothetical protein